MIAEIISIGTEVLMGNVENLDAHFLAKNLASLGYIVNHHVAVGDNEKRVLEVLDTAYKRADIIITTGGLGPTADDMSKDAVAKSLNMNLEPNEEARSWVKEYFDKIKREVYADSEYRASLIPSTAKLIKNNNGTAPGIIIEKNLKDTGIDKYKDLDKNIRVIMFPGPPRELKSIYYNGIDKYLMNINNLFFYSKMIKLFGMGESIVEKKLDDIFKAQTNPTLATYIDAGEVHIRIVGSGDTEEKAKYIVDDMIKKIDERLHDYIFTYDEEETLFDKCFNILKEKKMTVSFVESCTGGGLASRLTDIAGASSVLNESFITYSNESKVKNVGVDADLIKKYGVVSKEVAIDMAKKLRDKTNADICISSTGNLGPDVLDNKDVGEVYVGVSSKNGSSAKECHFTGDRINIKLLAIHAAYELLYNSIK